MKQSKWMLLGAMGIFGTFAITAVTSQNPAAVRRVDPIAPEAVASQIDAVMEKIAVKWCKTGMLLSAGTIEKVAEKLICCKKSGVIFNRVRGSFDPSSAEGIPDVLAVIGEDENQAENDMQGESVFSLPSESPLYKGAQKALCVLLQGENYENL